MAVLLASFYLTVSIPAMKIFFCYNNLQAASPSPLLQGNVIVCAQLPRNPLDLRL